MKRISRIDAIRRRTGAVCFALMGLLAINSPSGAQSRVIGYYPMWMKGILPASGVRFDYVTHVNHAFAWPDTDGTIASDDPTPDTAIINSAHRAGRKILLAFGGSGTTQTANFARVAADTTLRKRFIGNVLGRVLAYGYDGVDLDWEGPASAADRSNEVALVQQMRAEFSTVNTPLLITMAVGISDWTGQWRDYATLKLSVDWFNAMCYDIFGSWSPYTGHNAPMVEPPGHAADWSITQSIAYLHTTRGIPASQLTLGLPFFGQRFTNTAGLYLPFGSAAEVLYTDVRTDMENGWTYMWDTVSQVPYLVDPTQSIIDSFDDSSSIAIKCAYAKSQGLAGVMIWALGEDLWAGAQPLMDAVGMAMSPSTGVSQPSQLLAEGFILWGNYPNPFNPSTTVRYSLPRRSWVSLIVYNVIGQEVARLSEGTKEAGIHEVRFEAGGYSSGVYICRLRAGDLVQSRAMMLVK
jgi:chitinase